MNLSTPMPLTNAMIQGNTWILSDITRKGTFSTSILMNLVWKCLLERLYNTKSCNRNSEILLEDVCQLSDISWNPCERSERQLLGWIWIIRTRVSTGRWHVVNSSTAFSSFTSVYSPWSLSWNDFISANLWSINERPSDMKMDENILFLQLLQPLFSNDSVVFIL